MPFVYQMRVRKYIPEKMYGFAASKEGNVFFHLSVFKTPLEDINIIPPPPVVGEEIDVVLDSLLTQEMTPRAKRIQRKQKLKRLEGVVEFFNAKKGFGKISTTGGDEYFLHRSEVRDGKLPLAGHEVFFFAIEVEEQDKPRACHVEIRR